MSSEMKPGIRIVLPMRRGVVEDVFEDGFALKLDSGVTEYLSLEENWLEESQEPPEPKTLRDRITRAINATSSENGSDTPDFILAEYLVDCLAAFDKAVQRRTQWHNNVE